MSEELNTTMKDALYLEPEDVDANRDGQVSSRQVDRVLGQIRAVWYAVGCMWIITTAPLLILGLVISDNVLRIVIGVFILIWVWGIFRTAMRLRGQHMTVREDLATGETAWIEGELVKATRGSRSFYLGVDDLLFPAPQSVYDAIPEDTEVVIYYLPNSKQLLSIELADDEEVEEETEDIEEEN